MGNKAGRRRAPRRGFATVTVMYYLLIMSVLLMGMGNFAASHLQRATVDARYAGAMDLAEAGVNYELRRITASTANADQYPGSSQSNSSGSFTVYCTNSDGTTPWTLGNYLLVVSTGNCGGITRTIKASIKGVDFQGKYAVYGINAVSLIGNVLIVGDVGSDGAVSKGNSCGINGSVYLDGPNASYTGNTVSEVINPTALTWPTVDQKAAAAFPNGGLTYVATHNNNASAVPPISGNQITGPTKLIGPGDYYVTSISLNGNDQLEFDNRAGPINIWVGPSGGSGEVDFVGTTDGSTDSTASGNQVNLYCGTKGGVQLKGNATLAANVYCYNVDAQGNSYGDVTNKGTPIIAGSVLAWNADLSGTPEVQYVPGFVQPTSIGYFGFDTSWLEVNPR